MFADKRVSPICKSPALTRPSVVLTNVSMPTLLPPLNSELRSKDVRVISNPGSANPGLANPGLLKSGSLNPGLANPGLEKSGLENPGFGTPQKLRPRFTSGHPAVQEA